MRRSSRLRTRPGQFTCLDCRHRYSLTSGKALHNTKLPLRPWLAAMYLIATSSKGISAMKLSEWLGVSYKTAWHLGHRIRAMMASEPTLLRGVVELDETYVGGKPRKVHREKLLPEDERPRRKRGRGAADKACVFVAVERPKAAVLRAQVLAFQRLSIERWGNPKGRRGTSRDPMEENAYSRRYTSEVTSNRTVATSAIAACATRR